MRPGLQDLHVETQLLALVILARRARGIRAELLFLLFRQLLLDVFHEAVLPPSEIVQGLAGAVDVVVMLALRKPRHRLDVVVGPLGVVGQEDRRELPDRSRRASPSEHCNEEVIDYFGRCVEPAAQAAAILWT